MKNFLIRDALPQDISFIYSTWLNCYKADSYLGQTTSNTTFYENYRLIIDDMLARKQSNVLVACVPKDETTILGFIAAEGDNVVHFLYVKEPFRLMGIGTELVLQATGIGAGDSDKLFITHKTYTSEKYMRNRQNLEYDPFILFMKGSDE